MARKADRAEPARYDHAEVEPRWQRYWSEQQRSGPCAARAGRSATSSTCSRTRRASGLHVGHPEGYTATDIVARYKRMRGYDVLHPMGWDAFGLPAEQHAIKTGTHPRRDDAREHRHLQAPAEDARLQLRLVARGRHDRPRLRPLDAVDLPQALRARAWPSRPRFRSTGARRSAPCSPTRRSSTARASAAASRSCASRCASGSCASPPTPTGWPRTSSGSTGRTARCRSSATGSAAARAPRSTSPSPATRATTIDGLHHAPRHAVRRHLHGARARAPARRSQITTAEQRAEVEAYVAGRRAQERHASARR